MRQRVIVTGTDRFVGRSVASTLVASDWAQPLVVSVSDKVALRTALRGSTAIANCVGGNPETIARTANALYKALAEHSAAPRVVHLSSITVYGSQTGIVTEASPTLADLGPYSRIQLESEKLAREYGNAVILRPGAEFGPGCTDWSGRVARWLNAYRLGDLGSAGDGIANLVHISDLTMAVVRFLRASGVEGQVFNVVQPEKPTWNEYFVRFAQALGAVPVRRIGRRRLALETRLLALPLKLAENLARAARFRGIQLPPAIPPSLLRLCSQEIVVDASKITDELKLDWTPWLSGLQSAAFP